jgi:hypothetical protein
VSIRCALEAQDLPETGKRVSQPNTSDQLIVGLSRTTVGASDLFEINQNGDVMYLSANEQLGATVDASGTVVAPANRPAGLDCYGKTLDELRSSGRTMESSAQSE